MRKSLLVIVLNYNRPDLTGRLVADIRAAQFEYPKSRIDVMVVNALDDDAVEYDETGVLMMGVENSGFVRNWNTILGKELPARERLGFVPPELDIDHDLIACWNNDLRLESGFFAPMFKAFDADNVAVACPGYNSPHPFLRPRGQADVPYVEFTAPVFRRSALALMGAWDERFTHGWGVDIDWCVRAREQHGLRSVRAGDARLHHLEGGNYSAAKRAAYLHKAAADLKHLAVTLGPDWKQRLKKDFPGMALPLGW